jgi:hypothetical protein
MVEQTGIRPELALEAKLRKMLTHESGYIVLQKPDRLRAVLLVIANDDDPLGKQQESQGLNPSLRGLINDNRVE